MFPPGIEPRTLRVLGVRDNHYTTETLHVSTNEHSLCFFLNEIYTILLWKYKTSNRYQNSVTFSNCTTWLSINFSSYLYMLINTFEINFCEVLHNTYILEKDFSFFARFEKYEKSSFEFFKLKN